MTAPIDLDALERLIAAATPGPWGGIGRQVADMHTHFVKCYQHPTGASGSRNKARANAALIVATVNALPALIAELRDARRDAGRLSWLDRDDVNFECGLVTDTGEPTVELFSRATGDMIGKGPNIRAAIDAAIASGKP